MNQNPRSLLRVFLLVGGLAYLGLSVARGEVFGMTLGFLAAVLGGFGLLWEWRQQSTGAEE